MSQDEVKGDDLQQIPDRVRRALALLLQSHDYACQLRRDLWDFSVELLELRKQGATNGDLRWLICRELVEHAREITRAGSDAREFRPIGRLNLVKRSCFILTSRGVLAARGLAALSRPQSRPRPKPEAVRPACPAWDCDRREFRLGSAVIKRYKLPSPNQETILATFHHEGWPTRIEDPLPVTHDCDPKQRLRDTIKNLNRHHKVPAVRFKGDGTGQGVLWEIMAAEADHPS